MKDAKRLLQTLVSWFTTGGKTKTGIAVIKNPVFTNQLKTIVNWERTDPSTFRTWTMMRRDTQVRYIQDIKQGKLTVPQLVKQLREISDIAISPPKIDFTIKHGIQFFDNELLAIDQATSTLQTTINDKQSMVTYPKGFDLKLAGDFTLRGYAAQHAPNFTVGPTGQLLRTMTGFPQGKATRQEQITVHVVTRAHAMKIQPGLPPGTRGWDTGRHDSTEFYLVWEAFKLDKFKTPSAQLAEINRVITHEIAHLKDPSIVASPKLGRSYDSNAPYIDDTKLALSKKSAKNWKKNYYYHQWEVAANLAPVLKSITSNTRIILKSVGKKKTLVALDQLTQWAAQGTKFSRWMLLNRKLNSTATYILTGPSAKGAPEVNVVRFFDEFKIENPSEYRKVLNKLARQIESLKQQVLDTKNLTPESVINLKTLI